MERVFPVMLVLVTLLIFTSIHQVDEGHVGVYWRGGAILESTTEPGFNIKLPLITRYEQVQVTLQTDTVRDIPCGTSGGSIVYFDKIEVVNLLKKEFVYKTMKNYGLNYDKTWIFDKIHHEINQFCSKHTLQEVYIDKFKQLDDALANAIQESCDKWDTGIQVVSIRVTKPRIPDSLMKNFEEIEVKKTQLLVQFEKERVAKKEEEISRYLAKVQAQKEAEVARIEAERIANVSRITKEMELLEKETERKKSEIDDEIMLAKEKATSDASQYKVLKEAEANVKRYTPNYLKAVLYKSLTNNTHLFFGDSIPKFFTEFSKGLGLPNVVDKL
jgi:regulator of protease activity HflC (stomatin/prohibitin superfamily)